MTEITDMSPPTLLSLMLRNGVDPAALSRHHLIIAPDSRLTEGDLRVIRRHTTEINALMKSRADWLADVGIRETQP